MASEPTWNSQRGFWYVQYWDGKPRRKKVADAPPRWKTGHPKPAKAPPEAFARMLELQRKEKAARDRARRGVRPTSLAEFLEAHVEQYRNPRTRQTARIAVNHFLAWCQTRKFTRLDQIDRDACEAWAAAAAVQHSLSTIKTNRAFLAAAWGRLLKKGKIDANPWIGIEISAEDRAKSRDAWNREQFDRLAAKAAPWLRDILIFGVNTGLRIRALMEITWDDWIEDGPGFGYINVRKELDKIKAGYKIPVSEALHDLLFRRRADKHSHSIFILTGATGKPLKSRTQTHLAICRAAKKADLAIPRSPNHHMRRTFGRLAVTGDLTGEPIPVYVVSKYLGHKDVETTMIYLDLDESQLMRFMTPKTRPEGFIPPGSTTLPSAIPGSP